jgi:hypothetical protein
VKTKFDDSNIELITKTDVKEKEPPSVSRQILDEALSRIIERELCEGFLGRYLPFLDTLLSSHPSPRTLSILFNIEKKRVGSDV